jgi:hypothetical protein
VFAQARLTIDGRFFCGGTIISSNTILTAGHCVRQLSNPAGSDTTFSPKSVLVCLGTDVNACTQYALGDRMYVHPTFVSTVQFSNRIDLTVLKLQTPITTSANIGPLTLASTTNCPTCESSGSVFFSFCFVLKVAKTRGKLHCVWVWQSECGRRWLQQSEQCAQIRPADVCQSSNMRGCKSRTRAACYRVVCGPDSGTVWDRLVSRRRKTRRKDFFYWFSKKKKLNSLEVLLRLL